MAERAPLVAPAVPIDAIADAALQVRLQGPPAERSCDACGAEVEGEPGGRGLLLWSRGGDLVIEEPVLCEACATAIGMTAHRHWHFEEEDE